MRIFGGHLSSASKIWIWDSLASSTGQKVALRPRREGVITWYSCGPTVYDSAHIGHASSYIRLDIIRRILEKQNYKVLQIMGTTDIDDKIITRAKQLGMPWESLAEKYHHEFGEELEQLNIRPPHVRARVTQFIPHIINFIDKLVNTGLAYVTPDGSVYFDTESYGHYGIFASSESEDETTLKAAKRNKKDFALWKGWKPEEPFWNTPWGKGRPGWHIECSAIASHFFGSSLDIHSGGTDLIFPHHENEEAQCCAHFGIRKWVTHWIHTGHLVLQDVKMSKSLGNTLTISQFLKDNTADSFRMLCLNHNIRSHLYYSADVLNKAERTIRRFETFLTDCDTILSGLKPVSISEESSQFLWQLLKSTNSEVETALCDNFDTPAAVGVIGNFVSEFNSRHVYTKSMAKSKTVDYALVLASRTLVADFFDSMGFEMAGKKMSLNSDFSGELTDAVLQELVDFRQTVRSFSLAADEPDKSKRRSLIHDRQELMQACDNVRKRLANVGVELKDHGEKSSWSISRSVSGHE